MYMYNQLVPILEISWWILRAPRFLLRRECLFLLLDSILFYSIDLWGVCVCVCLCVCTRACMRMHIHRYHDLFFITMAGAEVTETLL
jgi:hypothetical protein